MTVKDRAEASPVNVKAVLLEPASMSVVWMNESASEDAEGGASSLAEGMPLAEAMPLAEQLGVPQAVAAVVRSGETQHLRTGLVSTTRGSLVLATSVYLLPDGMVLVLTENAWQTGREPKGDGSAHKPHRRRR